MSTYRPQSSDTSIDAEQYLVRRYRSMSPAEKMKIFRQLCRASQELALAGLRARHPDASPGQLRMRLAATRLSPAALRDAFDWTG